MSVAHRVIKNTGFLYAKMGITMFISLYTTRLVLNSLGAEDFGIFNIVGGAIAMLGFLNAAMGGATQRYMSYAEGEGNKEKLKKIFNISTVFHFLTALLLGFILIVAGWFFFNKILNIDAERSYAAKVVYCSLITSTVFTVMTVPYDAILNAHENMRYYSVVGVIESLMRVDVAFAVVYSCEDKLIVYGILMSFVPFITMIIMRVYCHRRYEECTIVPRLYWDKQLSREMVRYASWSLFRASTGMLSQYGLSIVLNSFYGTLLNAAQGIANQISGQLAVFSTTMMKVLTPIINKEEGTGNRRVMINTVMIGTKFSFFILSVFIIPFIIETPYILTIWLKKVPEWAVLFTRLQLLRSMIEQLFILMENAIAAKGNIKEFTISKSVLNILPVILTYFCFYFGYSPYFLYLNWITIGGIIGGGLLLYFTHKECGLLYSEYFIKVFNPCIKLLLIMFICGLFPLYFMPISFFRLLIVCFITTMAFVISLYMLLLTNQEKIIIRTLLSKILKTTQINAKLSV